MKTVLFTSLLIIGLGLLLNIGSSYKVDRQEVSQPRICGNAEFCPGFVDRVREERGWPFSQVSYDGEVGPLVVEPWYVSMKVQLGNLAFWIGVSGIMFFAFRRIKKRVSKTIFIGLIVIALLVYSGMLVLV